MYYCLIYGNDQLEKPQYDEGMNATFEVCPCCGVE